jgi:predicted house-cleaning noncanonical NTP pyrophosphatase (MazG superfamily)
LDNNGENIKRSQDKGFIRMDSYEELKQNLETLLSEKREFFSSMKSKKELGRIIEIANRESSYEQKAEKFLSLLRN